MFLALNGHDDRTYRGGSISDILSSLTAHRMLANLPPRLPLPNFVPKTKGRLAGMYEKQYNSSPTKSKSQESTKESVYEGLYLSQ